MFRKSGWKVLSNEGSDFLDSKKIGTPYRYCFDDSSGTWAYRLNFQSCWPRKKKDFRMKIRHVFRYQKTFYMVFIVVLCIYSVQRTNIRVSQFSQFSRAVTSLSSVFHPDSKNGLLSALRRILNLHSVLDSKLLLWSFLTFLAFDHFFRLATWKYKQKYNFWLLKFCLKTVLSRLYFRKTRKKGQTLNPLCKLDA